MEPIRAPVRRLSAFLVVFTLVATACTSREMPPLRKLSPPSSPAATPVPASTEGVGRLVVIEPDGNLLTMRPDGSDPVALTDEAGLGVQFFQPTWSPDGRRVAWVELRSVAGAPAARVVTSTFDGTNTTEAPVGATAFYLYWDPTSSRVAYLGTAGPDIELGLVDVAAGGDRATPLGSGRPFYFSWAPDGRQMLIHVGEDRLEKLGIDGSVTKIEARPGQFPAPAWSADGKSLVYASRVGRRQHLVIAHARGQGARDLVEFDETIRFVLSPDSRRPAYEAMGSGRDSADRALRVLDVENGEIETVSPAPALAFFWSPAGDRLLFLRPQVVGGQVWVRWHVWDGRDSFSTPRFRPGETFVRGYLPFFDQYAQSLSFWAPDGSAFTYAGVGESGEVGVWVQPARPHTEPVLVGGGSFVAWSPR